MNRAGTSTLEHDLLLRLGLSDGASEDDVESAHEGVVAFLESAPADLRRWARERIADADEAYALLSDPTALTAATAAASATIRTPSQLTAADRRARVAAPALGQQPQGILKRIGPFGRVVVAAAAVLAIAAGAYIVYASDLPTVPGLSGTPAPEGQGQLDTARVAELMAVIQADPTDVVALQELADLYFDVKDYGAVSVWENRILDVDPDNVTAHLALGAAQYNLGNSADAETHWRRVIEINPDDPQALAEAHYDLGFMYFSADPPDVPRTIEEWQAVIDIAPDSDIAQTVSTHLQTLEGWQASASPSGSPAASPTSSAVPSTVPSPGATPRPSSSPAQ